MRLGLSPYHWDPRPWDSCLSPCLRNAQSASFRVYLRNAAEVVTLSRKT